MTQPELPTYTWEEIAKHDKDDDCWVVLYDKVLDVSKFLDEHPGGLDPIKDMSGQDITSSYESIGHSSTATVRSKTFIVGRLDPASKKTVPAAKDSAPKWSETNREELLKYRAGGEIIPLWILIAGGLAVLAIVFYIW